jgi:DNA end-binding protein Ku
MRAIWSGAIGFGLVNIPIKIYSAVESSSLELHLLDKKNHAGVKYQRINESTGKPVEWENIVKGYEYEGGFVELTDKDFDAVSPEKSRTIDINEFVQEEVIDAMLIDTPYYLEPQKNGEKAYALLHRALTETGKIALGSFVLRNKELFCMIKAIEDSLLVLVKLRFPEEIRTTEEINIPKKITLKAEELKMAKALINQLSPKKINIAKYQDTYSAALMKLIEQKAKGKKVKQPAFKIAKITKSDLMSQLKESLKNKKAS